MRKEIHLSSVCSKKYRTARVKGNSKENFERERERERELPEGRTNLIEVSYLQTGALQREVQYNPRSYS